MTDIGHRLSIDTPFELWYYPSENRFHDEDNNVLHGLQEFFPVWQIEIWKARKAYACLKARTGDLVEMWYLDEETEEYIKTHSFMWENDYDY